MAGPTPAATGRIFISYRREETAYPAGWLFDRLADRFGGSQVFKDVDSIQLGDDFERRRASRRRKSRSAFSDGAAHPGQPARRSACPAPVGARRSLASRYARTLVRRADAARAGWLRDGPPGGRPIVLAAR
jgi:hypothetical protein